MIAVLVKLERFVLRASLVVKELAHVRVRHLVSSSMKNQQWTGNLGEKNVLNVASNVNRRWLLSHCRWFLATSYKQF